jgi:hypothetical protein
MKNNLFLTFIITFVFISSSSYMQAEYGFSSEQKQIVDSMTIQELKDRKLSIEDQISQLEEDKENTQNPSTIKSISDSIASLEAELVYIIGLLVGVGLIISDDDDDESVTPPVIDVTPPVITLLAKIQQQLSLVTPIQTQVQLQAMIAVLLLL